MKLKLKNSSLSRGQKSKFPAMALGLSLAMAAPTFGAIVWTGSASDGLWNTPSNWTGSTGGRDILNGDTVTLSGAAGISSSLEVKNGSTLNISTDLDSSDDLEVGSGSTVNMNAGFYEQGEKLKLSGAFFMNGGTATVDNKLEIANGGILALSGGRLEANDGDGIEFDGDGGTVRVDGVWTGAGTGIFVDAITGGTGTFEFTPTVGGLITPITNAGGSSPQHLVVDLDALAASAAMTLFEASVAQSAFVSVTITKDGDSLTEGTGPNQYQLSYTGGSGNDLVLTYNAIPEPSSMGLLALGGLGLLRRRRRAY